MVDCYRCQVVKSHGAAESERQYTVTRLKNYAFPVITLQHMSLSLTNPKNRTRYTPVTMYARKKMFLSVIP